MEREYRVKADECDIVLEMVKVQRIYAPKNPKKHIYLTKYDERGEKEVFNPAERIKILGRCLATALFRYLKPAEFDGTVFTISDKLLNIGLVTAENRKVTIRIEIERG